MARGHPPGAGRRRAPPLWARLLVLLLVVCLAAMYSYAGCQQMRARHNTRERIEAVEAIRGYVQRLEAALEQVDERAGVTADGEGEPQRHRDTENGRER